MITQNNVVSISQMRREADKILTKVKSSQEPIYLFSRSTPKAVILDIDYFANLQYLLEDYLDRQELLSVGKDETRKASDWKTFKKSVRRGARD